MRGAPSPCSRSRTTCGSDARASSASRPDARTFDERLPRPVRALADRRAPPRPGRARPRHLARSAGGRLILRIEDLDGPRVVPGSADRQREDLEWLGLDWDEGPGREGADGPYRQSERSALYEGALRLLREQDRLYFCDCSRAEVARIASAPHPGEEGPRYPGLCRSFGLAERPWRRPPALRLAVPEGSVELVDRFQGAIRQDVSGCVGDFVLKRGDGVYSYQLAVVVDDLAMGISEVVRGADLLGSAPRQVLLAELLGGRAPGYAHAPLVLSPDGSRLAKRARGVALRDHRAAGRRPGQIGRAHV